MNGWLRRLVALSVVLGAVNASVAQETAAPAPVQRPIPFKTDSASLEDQSLHTLALLAGLLAATAAGLYFLRRRLPGAVRGIRTSRLQIIERTRINPRCTLYLASLDQREFVFAQCGDTLTQLTQLQPEHSPASAPIKQSAGDE